VNHNFLIDFPVLNTNRLRLRQPKSTDSSGVFTLRSDTQYSIWTGIPRYINIEEAVQYIARIHDDMRCGTCIFWTICKNSQNRFIGSICLWNICWEEKQAEIGYDLLPDYRGNGFMLEAVQSVMAYAFSTLGFSRIVADNVHPDNHSSVALLVRADFLPLQKPGSYERVLSSS